MTFIGPEDHVIDSDFAKCSLSALGESYYCMLMIPLFNRKYYFANKKSIFDKSRSVFIL